MGPSPPGPSPSVQPPSCPRLPREPHSVQGPFCLWEVHPLPISHCSWSWPQEFFWGGHLISHFCIFKFDPVMKNKGLRWKWQRYERAWQGVWQECPTAIESPHRAEIPSWWRKLCSQLLRSPPQEQRPACADPWSQERRRGRSPMGHPTSCQTHLWVSCSRSPWRAGKGTCVHMWLCMCVCSWWLGWWSRNTTCVSPVCSPLVMKVLRFKSHACTSLCSCASKVACPIWVHCQLFYQLGSLEKQSPQQVCVYFYLYLSMEREGERARE